MPNGQKPVKQTWPEIAEEISIAIHNAEIRLELMQAELKAAQAHVEGK